jgi:hypothetical protein
LSNLNELFLNELEYNEILFEFDEEFNMNYYMDLVDETIYKSAAILDYSTQYPTCPMSREFPDYTPYFDKIKKLERKK